ncbi:MAG: hypothetical protein WCQ47_07135 [bacterium]
MNHLTGALCAKINRYYELKMEMKILEQSLAPLNVELKEIAKEGPKNEKGDWVIESNEVRVVVSDQIKVMDDAVSYLQTTGRDDLVSVKLFTRKEALFQVISEEEAHALELIDYITSLRPTLKNKEQLFKEVLTPSIYTQNQKVIQMRSSVAKQRRN